MCVVYNVVYMGQSTIATSQVCVDTINMFENVFKCSVVSPSSTALLIRRKNNGKKEANKNPSIKNIIVLLKNIY